MKKLRRLLIQLILLVIVVLAGAFFFNTVNYASRQIPIEAIASKAISEEVHQRLAEVVQIPTVSFETHIDTAAFIQFKNYLQTHFPLVDSLLEREVVNDFSLIYKWQGTNPRLEPALLLGHIDIVPVEGESLKKWTLPPYSGTIQDGFIWGRGTLDDKVSILGVLEATSLLLKEDYQPERTLYMGFGHDEEVGGLNGAKAIAQRFEQQNIQFEYILDEGMVVLEDALPGLDQPTTLIGVAEKGYATLKVTAQLEQGGHSSMPPSETAIGLLSKTITKLEQNPFPAKITGATKLLFDHVGPEMSLPNKLVFANTWFFENILLKQLKKSPSADASVRTTMAPTILEGGLKENVMPSTASVTINFRILPGETVASVTQRLKEVIDDDRIQVSTTKGAFSSEPSAISDTKSFGYQAIQKTAQEIFPKAIVTPALVVVATDSRHYQKVANNIFRFLPVQLNRDDLKRIHGIDERIAKDSYKKVIHFYHQLIKNSCH